MATAVTASNVTLAQARARVFGLINETAEGSFTNAKVDAELNACARKIYYYSSSERVDIYRTTQDGRHTYEIPDSDLAGGNAIVHKVYIDYGEITEKLYEPVNPDDAEGEPSEYAVFGSSLVLYPTPDAEYQLRIVYQREYKPLTNDSDTFQISDLQVDACIYHAAYAMKLMDEEYTAAGMFRSLYEETFDLATRQVPGVYKNKNLQ